MTASLLIRNARVLTMDPSRPRAEAVLLRGNRIAAVGSEKECAALADPDTPVLDARGASLLPGFVESHMHLFAGAAEMEDLDLRGVSGVEALSEAVRAYAAAHPARPILVAQAADYTILSAETRPTRRDLDAILLDRPLALVAPDHHTVWANTAALERAGLLHGAALSVGNEVVMGEDGLATGELREFEAFEPVLGLGSGARASLGLATGGEPEPPPGPREIEEDLAILRRGLAYAASLGITSIHNMDGNRYTLDLLARLEAAGELPCRVRVPFHYRNWRRLEDLEAASAWAREFSSPKLSSGFVKVFLDGVLDSWTAVMIEPYADAPGVTGEPLFSPEDFAALAVEIDRRGLQIAVHAIGDGAVCTVLDGYEAARRANGPRDSRHRVEHIEVVHPDDIPRFAELGAIASMQPVHPPGTTGVPLEPTVSRIGRARWPFSYAWRSLKDAGAPVAFSTDWPVSPLSPLAAVQSAMTRPLWADDMPDQRLDLAETLHAYTAGGAYAEFAEDRKGRIAPGLLADIVVLGGNIEATEPANIGALGVRLTLCDGAVTFDGTGADFLGQAT